MFVRKIVPRNNFRKQLIIVLFCTILLFLFVGVASEIEETENLRFVSIPNLDLIETIEQFQPETPHHVLTSEQEQERLANHKQSKTSRYSFRGNANLKN
jgi:predicted PurR-regulated permease PerM